ncbi:MAG: hypothetical protein ABDI20_09155 [Candidatus Bipolaricaulaceae bacterium]
MVEAIFYEFARLCSALLVTRLYNKKEASMSFSVIVPGEPTDVANKVSKVIYRLFMTKLEYSQIKKEQETFVVEYWGDESFFVHGCWIKVTVKRMDDKHCIVTISGCEDTLKFAHIIVDEIKS